MQVAQQLREGRQDRPLPGALCGQAQDARPPAGVRCHRHPAGQPFQGLAAAMLTIRNIALAAQKNTGVLCQPARL